MEDLTIIVARQNKAPLPDGSAFGDANRGLPPMGEPRGADTGPPARVAPRPKQPWLWGLRLRTKILAVLLVPAIVAVALGALALNDRLQNASRYDTVDAGVQLTQAAAGLANELQRERDLMTSLVAANRNRDRGPVQQQKAKVDDAVSRFRAAKDKAGGQSSAVQNAYTRAADRLDSVGPLRSVAETTQFPDDAAFNSYTSIIDTMLQVEREIASSDSDSTVTRLARAADAIGRAHEQVGQERSLVLAAILRGTFPASQIAEIQAAGSRHDAAIADFLNAAGTTDNTLYSDTVAGPEVDGRERLRQVALARGQSNQPLNINYDEWDRDSGVTMDLLNQVQTKLLSTERATAQDSGTQLRDAALLSAVPVLLALILTVILALLIARSILRQLRVLRTTALEVADTRLPEAVQRILADPNPIEASKNAIPPVPVFTNEEIGQLARSFDVVHNQAVRLAAEQAVLRDNVNAMFVNLSRRSQTLVERQLSLIDRLEQDEQDPDQLSNLFELDHLATRMRRNSENLLVLSGSGFGKRLNRPVQVGELVGAAVSEVEQYARVEVAPPPDIAVQGWVVNDLIHLIAELLDNATAYSEPQTKVSVRIAKTRNQELAIQISDRGVGMSENDIAEANIRLSNPPDIDVAVSRRMGLYVVARLAKRHGIRVRLHTSEDIDGGTRATIAVPTDLVTSSSPQNQEPARSGIASAFGSSAPPMTAAELSSPSMGGMFPPIRDQAPQETSGSLDAVRAAFATGQTGQQAAVRGTDTGPNELRDLTELIPPASSTESGRFRTVGAEQTGSHQQISNQQIGNQQIGNQPGGYDQRGYESGGYEQDGYEQNGYENSGYAEPGYSDEQVADGWAGDQQTAQFGAAARSASLAYGTGAYDGGQPEYSGALAQDDEPDDDGFVPQIDFVAGDSAEQNAGDVPPWVGSDSDELRQLVAAWQQQGMQEQDEIHAERTGKLPHVRPAANGRDSYSAQPAESAMNDFEAEDQTASAFSSMAGANWAQQDEAQPKADVETHRDLDAPTERLPIYEAVLSQWFRADEGDPVDPLDQASITPPELSDAVGSGAQQAPGSEWITTDPDDGAADLDHPAAETAYHPVPEPEHRRQQADPSEQQERTSRPRPSPRPRGLGQTWADAAQLSDLDTGLSSPSPAAPAPLPEPAAGLGAGRTNGISEQSGLPKRTPGARTWKSPADDGWSAAQSLLTAKNDDVTSAGLPKRVPKAHLVPGSAQPQAPKAPGLAVPPRSADTTRTRMSSFQKGIRRGRHARVDALAERLSQDSPHAGGNGHDEGRM